MSLLVVAVLVRCNWSIDLGVAYLPLLCASGPRRMILVTGLGGLPNASHTCTLLLLFHGRKWRKGRRRNPIPNRWRHVTFLWWKADVAMIFFPFFTPPEKKEKDIWLFFEGDEWGRLPAEKVYLGLECEGILPVLLEWAIYLASMRASKTFSIRQLSCGQ